MSKYTEWLKLSTDLKALKALEMKTRKELCVELFEGRVGKEKKVLADVDGYKVVAENKISYKLDKEALLSMWKELSEEECAAVKWTPDVKPTPFLKLPTRCLLSECVTIKPASPTLTVTKLKE